MKKTTSIASCQRRQFTRQFYQGNGWNLALALIQIFVSVAAQLLIAWLLLQLTDLITGNSDYSILRLALAGLGCLLLFCTASWLDYVSKPRFLSRAVQQYKNYVFREITKKNISAFSGENASFYISALSNDINTIENDYLANIFSLISNVLLFIGTLAVMSWYSPTLTLVSIVLSLLPVVASILVGSRAAEAETIVSEKNDSFMSTLKDSLTGFSVIKSFQAESAMCRLFAESVRQAADAKCHSRKVRIIIELLGSMAGFVAQFGVMLVGGWLAISGKGISAGVVTAFIQLMNYIINPIATVPRIWASRKAAFALIDKLAAALSENVRHEGVPIEKELRQSIQVRGLSFSYDGEKEVLQQISACFEAGKSYAIVGTSGSGKSTLLNLLMAGHSDYQGQILFDGRELRNINSDSLYELVSMVQQNVFVFNSSIRDNITMFHPFPAAEVDEAIRLSGLTEVITQKGEDYICGENGSGLSGGEKQRISIARCLLRKSPVLLVDEATAALDNQTSWQVMHSILALKGLTRIVVTHALDETLLKRYDCILALKNGRIVEAATFDELMEQKGYFYSLYTVSQ